MSKARNLGESFVMYQPGRNYSMSASLSRGVCLSMAPYIPFISNEFFVCFERFYRVHISLPSLLSRNEAKW